MKAQLSSEQQQQPLFIDDKNIKANKLVGSCTNKIHKKLQLKIKIILIKYNFDKTNEVNG